MEYVLGIDCGTSYFKLGLFDRQGTLCGLGRVEVNPQTDDTGRCELPVGQFRQRLRTGLDQACQQAKAGPDQIVAVSYSSQANSFLLLDENGQPLTPLILWPDHRATKMDVVVEQLWRRDDFLQTTGLGVGPSPEFCINKIRWFQQHQPVLWSRAKRLMTLSDYLVFSLTGTYQGDEGTASLLGLRDVQSHCWWSEALQVLDLPVSMLSELHPPGTTIGTACSEAKQWLGVSTGIPVVAGSLDHHIAAVGAGAGKIAPMSESTGTVLAVLALADRYEPRADCCTGVGTKGGYYTLAFTHNGAAALEWYQKNYASKLTIAELVKLAEPVSPGADGLIALPGVDQYSGLEGFRNRNSSHEAGHFTRAILESVSASLKGLVDQMVGQNRPTEIVATGGGAKSDVWLQIKADMLGVNMIAADCEEPACRGAAMLAAPAAGGLDRLDTIAEQWIDTTRVFSPNPVHQRAYLKRLDRYNQRCGKG